MLTASVNVGLWDLRSSKTGSEDDQVVSFRQGVCMCLLIGIKPTLLCLR